MKINRNTVTSKGIRLSVQENDSEVARAFLYVMYNDLHDEPFGLMEDVFVDESYRGKGYGTQLVKEIIKVAREFNCYKLIATSRNSRLKVHQIYKHLGFEEQGIEFRLEL